MNVRAITRNATKNMFFRRQAKIPIISLACRK